MEQYSKNINLQGNLFIDGIDHGLLRYEFIYNPYNTNDMRITLYYPHISIPEKLRNAKEAYVYSGTPDMNFKILLNSKFISHHISLGSRVSCPVIEYNTFQIFEEFNENNSIDIYYYFPLTSLSDFNNSFSDDNSAPLLQVINTNISQYKLRDIFQIETDRRNDLYEIMNLIKESTLFTTQIKIPSDYSQIISQSDNIADKICDIISLIDRDRIKWKRKEIYISDSSKKILGYSKNYRWASPPSDNYSYKINHNKNKNSSLELIYQAYNRLSVEGKNTIDELFEYFQIANCSKTIETKFIHWYSCLDYLKKYFGSSKRYFSPSIVDIFDRNNIALDDVIDNNLLCKIRNNNKKAIFEFTRIRNNYIHDGFGSIRDDYPIILNEIKKIIILCDRLFLRILNIDYKDTCLGSMKT